MLKKFLLLVCIGVTASGCVSYHPLRGESGSSEVHFTDGTGLRCPSDSYVELGKIMGVVPYEVCRKKPDMLAVTPSLYNEMRWKFYEFLERAGLKEKEEKEPSPCVIAPQARRRHILCIM